MQDFIPSKDVRAYMPVSYTHLTLFVLAFFVCKKIKIALYRLFGLAQQPSERYVRNTEERRR